MFRFYYTVRAGHVIFYFADFSVVLCALQGICIRVYYNPRRIKIRTRVYPAINSIEFSTSRRTRPPRCHYYGRRFSFESPSRYTAYRTRSQPTADKTFNPCLSVASSPPRKPAVRLVLSLCSVRTLEERAHVYIITRKNDERRGYNYVATRHVINNVRDR